MILITVDSSGIGDSGGAETPPSCPEGLISPGSNTNVGISHDWLNLLPNTFGGIRASLDISGHSSNICC